MAQDPAVDPRPRLYKFFHFEMLQVLQCSIEAITIANSRAFLHEPFVSSTL